MFKDNVLVEILKTKDQILQTELEVGVLPAEFKLELNNYIDELDYQEDQAKYLSRELRKNQIEELTQPNTLLLMQDAASAPWSKNEELNKATYVL